MVYCQHQEREHIYVYRRVHQRLPDNLLDAQLVICKRFKSIDGARNPSSRAEYVEDYIAALAFAKLFADARGIVINVPEWDIKKSDSRNIQQAVGFFEQWYTSVSGLSRQRERIHTIESIGVRYASFFGKAFFYEFSDNDFERVQQILNNLRNIIVTSVNFGDEHRRRLLKKLEKLQAELHKRMPNFDIFWGFFIDSGIALTKFWENVKPIRDDVKELAQIICRTQAKAENVQKFFPLKFLTEGTEDENDKSES